MKVLNAEYDTDTHFSLSYMCKYTVQLVVLDFLIGPTYIMFYFF